MTSHYQIEQVNYDLISQATNLNGKQKSKLFGYTNRYVAVRPVENGYEILMNTLGGRDECVRALKNLEKALVPMF
ncbi:MAG: hypothetical protein HC913_22265 [Microscillaceae bacterium]|nr:hypothetical protein [Microscillaceae bacterium]